MTLDRVLSICKKHKISPNQYVLLYFIINEDYEGLSEYVKAFDKSPFNEREFIDLEEKGIIMLMPYKDKIKLSDIVIQPGFLHSVTVDAREAAEDFNNAFYDLIEVNGTYFPARNIPIEDIETEYKKVHKGDKEYHKKLIAALIKMKSSLPQRGNQRIGKFAMKKFFMGQMCQMIIDDFETGSAADTQTSL